jgi:hypothetical protein
MGCEIDHQRAAIARKRVADYIKSIQASPMPEDHI